MASAEFSAAYEAAIDGKPTPRPVEFSAKTLGWLIERYRESNAWAKLSSATRRQREGILRAIAESAGAEPISRIDKHAIYQASNAR